MEKVKILILDDDKNMIDELCEYLLSSDFICCGTDRPSKALEILDQEHFDIVITDMLMPEMDGIKVTKAIKSKHPYIDVIVMTGYGNITTVVKVFRAGATDFFTKPFNLYDVKASIERTERQRLLTLRAEKAELKYNLISAEFKKGMGIEMVGSSTAMRKVVGLVSMVSKTNGTTVLITGESGTGKELIARGIHALSERRNQRFHSVNCSAIPESLFESEFFGFSRGAFTGANEHTSGWFEVSHKSTLFLDEIAELPLSLQAKFLRVLDNQVISKIGEKKDISLDIRIIAATNQNLNTLVENGKFRNDLFHRLNAFVINVPPLRERKDDIPDLIHYFIDFFNKKLDRNIKQVDKKVHERLLHYDFPGNVRELKNIIEQAMILCEDNTLRLKHLVMDRKIAEMESSQNYHKEFDLEEVEKNLITKALEQTSFNKSRASRLLKISRQALDRKMQKYGINSWTLTERS